MRQHAQHRFALILGSRHTIFSHMQPWPCAGWLILALATCTIPARPVWAQNAALDAAFAKLAKLEQGQGLAMLSPIEQAITRARNDETLRRDLEARFIATLQGNSSDLARDYACRQLVLVGRDASVPVLAQLLSNERSSYMARYALEGIGGHAATRALREMLGKTSGRQQLGIVISLGRLADEESVTALSGLLSREDKALRGAVLVALGRIGTVPAADALRGFAASAPAGLKNELAAATVQAAENLCRRKEYRAALQLGEPLLSAESERIRAAAWRVTISARPHESLDLIVAGLRADEPWKRAVAADCVVALQRPAEIGTIAASVPTLPLAGKVAALNSLKDRSDPAVRKAALRCLNERDVPVRAAAVRALIASGTAADVPLLVDIASTADRGLRHAALETLRLMTAAGTNRAITDLLNSSKTSNPLIVKCALSRRSPVFNPAFLKAAESPDAQTRVEAFKALEIMAGESEAQPLARLLSRTAPGAEREAADRAVWMSCQKIADPAARTAPLLAAMKMADETGRSVMLPTLARFGGEASLAAVHAAMQSGNQQLRDAGYRALANWPDATVAEELLAIAKSGPSRAFRIAALRAYARVITLPGQRPPHETFQLLQQAMKLATRSEDKELIVSRLGSVRVPEALALLLTYLEDQELKESAVPAIFTLAKGLSQTHPEQARAAFKRIEPLTSDAAMLQQIPKVLRDIDSRLQKRKK